MAVEAATKSLAHAGPDNIHTLLTRYLAKREPTTRFGVPTRLIGGNLMFVLESIQQPLKRIYRILKKS